MASGPGPSLRTTPACAIPKADDDSAGRRPDVLLMLLLGILSCPWPGGSSEPVASCPWLGLKPPQALFFSDVFFSLPRALATCQATRPSGRKASWPVLCPPSWVETDADHPKGHCSPPQGAARANSPFKQTPAVTQIASHAAPDKRTLWETVPEPNAQIHE